MDKERPANEEIATEREMVTVKEETAPPLDTVQAQENQIIEEEPVPVAPSAPAIEEDEPLQNLLYPNLHSVKANSIQQTKERIILKPFTNDQLKELYNNPELILAETFESDFINTELNNTHKDHPLFELIKKYSHSRYNLKVNMLDLHAYIKCFQENSQKVWIIENRITTYEGVCADGERIRKNELYE